MSLTSLQMEAWELTVKTFCKWPYSLISLTLQINMSIELLLLKILLTHLNKNTMSSKWISQDISTIKKSGSIQMFSRKEEVSTYQWVLMRSMLMSTLMEEECTSSLKSRMVSPNGLRQNGGTRSTKKKKVSRNTTRLIGIGLMVKPGKRKIKKMIKSKPGKMMLRIWLMTS